MAKKPAPHYRMRLIDPEGQPGEYEVHTPQGKKWLAFDPEHRVWHRQPDPGEHVVAWNPYQLHIGYNKAEAIATLKARYGESPTEEATMGIGSSKVVRAVRSKPKPVAPGWEAKLAAFRDAPMATTNAGMGASKEVVDDLQRKAKSITGSDFAADATERAMASKSAADHREAAKSHAAAVEAADAVGDMQRALHHEAMERLHHDAVIQVTDSKRELERRVATGEHKYGAAASASVQPSAPSVIEPLKSPQHLADERRTAYEHAAATAKAATAKAHASKSVADHRAAQEAHKEAERAGVANALPRWRTHSHALAAEEHETWARHIETTARAAPEKASAESTERAPTSTGSQPAHAARLAAFRDQPGPATPAVPAKAAAGVAGRRQKGEGKAVLQSKSGRSYFLTPGGHRRYID